MESYASHTDIGDKMNCYPSPPKTTMSIEQVTLCLLDVIYHAAHGLGIEPNALKALEADAAEARKKYMQIVGS